MKAKMTLKQATLADLSYRAAKRGHQEPCRDPDCEAHAGCCDRCGRSVCRCEEDGPDQDGGSDE